MTIGEKFCGWHDDLGQLSYGEFDTKFMAKYPRPEWLIQCCRLALEGLSREIYLGRFTNARDMARTMELLREKHGVDVPRGWYSS